MLPGRNTPVAASRQIPGIALLTVLLALPVIGQSDPHALRIDAPLVDRSHGERAYRLVDTWLKASKVPDEVVAPIQVTGLIGVKITLRNAGFTLGAATAYRPNLDRALDQPGPAVDMVPLLQKAARDALRAVNRRLDDVQLRHQLDGIELPNEKPEPRQIGGLVLLDIQLAHHLESVRISPDAPPRAVLGKFAPGFHGLRVMVPNAMQPRGSILWPASALAANIGPESQIKGLLSEQGYDHTALSEIARPKGPILQRFDVIHYAQPRRDLPMVQLVRGNVPLHARAIDSSALEGMADRLHKNLIQRFLIAAVRGTYHPTSGRYDPPYGNDEEVALACYAVTRHERFLSRRKAYADDETNHVPRNLALELARAAVEPDSRQSPAVTALALLTLIDSAVPYGGGELREQLGQRLLSLRVPGRGFRREPGAEATVNRATAAAVTAALAALYEQTRSPELGTAVREILQELWAQKPNASGLYWLALAYHRISDLMAEAQDSADDPHVLARGLAEQIAKLSEQQVIEPPIVGPMDVMGGFELHRGQPGSPPTPDWTSATLLAFVAVCLQDERIAEDQDSNGWILTATLAARFIGQLMMADTSCYYVHHLNRTLDGVRQTLWDNKLAVAPTAMSLLAVVELQEAVESLTRPAHEPSAAKP